jgi:tryptophan synthase alpha chain
VAEVHGALEQQLRTRRAQGRKLLVPYVTAGLDDDWPEVVRAVAAAGADAIEIGIPFSDPVMDGPVIQEASTRALERGATPPALLRQLATVDAGVPLATMLYYNLVFRAGHERFAASLAEAGVAGCIVPDLPLEEAGPWCEAADAAGVETVMLAAPTAPDERLPRVCARARGFVYSVGLLGVTGERATLAGTATELAGRLKRITDKPVLVGVGVSDAAQAVEVCRVADGVAIGSALIRRLLEGAGPEGAAAFVGEVRSALDSATAGVGAPVLPPAAPGCELCEAARFTHWYSEDEVCWVADCEVCETPMVVWRGHGTEPPAEQREHMLAQLTRAAVERFGPEGWKIDGVMRQIPDHFHAHARDPEWQSRRWSSPPSRYTGVGGTRNVAGGT